MCPDEPISFVKSNLSRDDFLKANHGKKDRVYGYLTSRYESNEHPNESFDSKNWFALEKSDLNSDGRILQAALDNVGGDTEVVDADLPKDMSEWHFA